MILSCTVKVMIPILVELSENLVNLLLLNKGSCIEMTDKWKKVILIRVLMNYLLEILKGLKEILFHRTFILYLMIIVIINMILEQLALFDRKKLLVTSV